MDTVSSTSPLSLIVRPMESRDAQAVTVLIGQLGYERPMEAVVRWIERLHADGENQAAYVACVQEEVVGWIEVSIENCLQSPPTALIGGLVVKEGVRGLGVGRRLCEQAEVWSWQRSVDTLRVTSRSTRKGAHRFYLRDGYRLVKTWLVFEKKRPD